MALCPTRPPDRDFSNLLIRNKLVSVHNSRGMSATFRETTATLMETSCYLYGDDVLPLWRRCATFMETMCYLYGDEKRPKHIQTKALFSLDSVRVLEYI